MSGFRARPMIMGVRPRFLAPEGRPLVARGGVAARAATIFEMIPGINLADLFPPLKNCCSVYPGVLCAEFPQALRCSKIKGGGERGPNEPKIPAERSQSPVVLNLSGPL